MSCDEFKDEVGNYIVDGSLDICRRVEVRVHIDVCEECRAIYVKKRFESELKEKGY